MSSRRSTRTAKVATETEKRSLWPGATSRLVQSGGNSEEALAPANVQRAYHCHPNDYVSARAEARSNSNVGQGHTGSVPLFAGGASDHRQRLEGMIATVPPLRSVGVGSVENKMVVAHATTPNPSIEGMPKRLRLSVTPHVKR